MLGMDSSTVATAGMLKHKRHANVSEPGHTTMTLATAARTKRVTYRLHTLLPILKSVSCTDLRHMARTKSSQAVSHTTA